jgi:Ca2+-dependent lipid-binding protein
MPCILKVRVIAGRGLPVMDRASELTDAYVEVRFGDLETQRTSVCRKSLNPVWNEDFRLEVSDDVMLQDEPLELKVFDYDAISADDSIGTVMLDLNPLLAAESTGQLAGWFPIFDTIRGMRGELNVQAKLQFFGDTNPFKESSAGVKFFCGNGIPSPYPVRRKDVCCHVI